MNHIFKTVWNHVRRCYVAVNETVMGASQSLGSTSAVIIIGAFNLCTTPSFAGYEGVTEIYWNEEHGRYEMKGSPITVTGTINEDRKLSFNGIINVDQNAIWNINADALLDGANKHIPHNDQITNNGRMVIGSNATFRVKKDREGEHNFLRNNNQLILNGGRLEWYACEFSNAGLFHIANGGQAIMGQEANVDPDRVLQNSGRIVVDTGSTLGTVRTDIQGTGLFENNGFAYFRSDLYYGQDSLARDPFGGIHSSQPVINNGTLVLEERTQLYAPSLEGTGIILLPQYDNIRKNEYDFNVSGNVTQSNFFVEGNIFVGGDVNITTTALQKDWEKITHIGLCVQYPITNPDDPGFADGTERNFQFWRDRANVDKSGYANLFYSGSLGVTINGNLIAPNGTLITALDYTGKTDGLVKIGKNLTTGRLENGSFFTDSPDNHSGDLIVVGVTTVNGDFFNMRNAHLQDVVVDNRLLLGYGLSLTSNFQDNNLFELDRNALLYTLEAENLQVGYLKNASNIVVRTKANIGGGENTGNANLHDVTLGSQFVNSGSMAVAGKLQFKDSSTRFENYGTLTTGIGNVFTDSVSESEGLNYIGLTASVPQEVKTSLTQLFTRYVSGQVAQALADHATFTGGKVIITGVNLTTTQRDDLTKAFKERFFNAKKPHSLKNVA